MSKQAMELALEALEAWHTQDLDEQQADTAISALKEAIKQQDAEPAACPFCGCEMTIRSNRDWHHLDGDHDEACPFDDRPETTMTVPATDEQLRIMIGDWNRRHNISN